MYLKLYLLILKQKKHYYRDYLINIKKKKKKKKFSPAGYRSRSSAVKTRYPNHVDNRGLII